MSKIPQYSKFFEETHYLPSVLRLSIQKKSEIILSSLLISYRFLIFLSLCLETVLELLGQESVFFVLENFCCQNQMSQLIYIFVDDPWNLRLTC